MLDTVYDVGQDHTGDREDQDADEDLIGLKGCACDGDHEADTRSCRVELAHHDTDERPAYRQAQTRQDERHSGRQHDGLKNLPFRRAETSGGGKQIGRGRLYAISGVDQQRENCAQEDNADLGKYTDT